MSRPMCEECDLEMHPFAVSDGLSGWGCDSCGWSYDETPGSSIPVPELYGREVTLTGEQIIGAFRFERGRYRITKLDGHTPDSD
jgi:hypothetical protein